MYAIRSYYGWSISTFYGQPAISHTGGLWGMTTILVILPEQKLAVFVSNNLLSPAPRAVAYDIVDQVLRDDCAGASYNFV